MAHKNQAKITSILFLEGFIITRISTGVVSTLSYRLYSICFTSLQFAPNDPFASASTIKILRSLPGPGRNEKAYNHVTPELPNGYYPTTTTHPTASNLPAKY